MPTTMFYAERHEKVQQICFSCWEEAESAAGSSSGPAHMHERMNCLTHGYDTFYSLLLPLIQPTVCVLFTPNVYYAAARSIYMCKIKMSLHNISAICKPCTAFSAS